MAHSTHHTHHIPKSARGVIDAHESSISKLQHELRQTQEKVKSFEQHFPTLEGQAKSNEEDLFKTRQALEEKAAALSQARKQLKAVKERNTVISLSPFPPPFPLLPSSATPCSSSSLCDHLSHHSPLITLPLRP